MSSLIAALKQLIVGQDLTEQQSHDLFAAALDGSAGEAQIAAILTALRMKGETVPELVGLARVMRARVTAIPTQRRPLLDTCGTGGDELRTFNISTAAAIVCAACGLSVAKHGNRSVSSSSGSADVLEQLGVNLTLNAEQVGRCIDELGLGFCFAPLLHAAMKHVAPVRKALGIRTIFNLMGPLTNPARAEYQLIGANRAATAQRLAEALCRLGTERALVVCGNDELDEVSLWGQTDAWLVTGGEVRHLVWQVADLGLTPCHVSSIQVQSAAESADRLRAIFLGETGAAREIVLANAGAALLASGVVHSIRDGVQRAATAIDAGEAQRLLERLITRTNELARSNAATV